MSKYIYVGLDVHKESIVIAWCQSGRGEKVNDYGKVSGSVANLERVLRRLAKRGGFHREAHEVLKVIFPRTSRLPTRKRKPGIAIIRQN